MQQGNIAERTCIVPVDEGIELTYLGQLVLRELMVTKHIFQTRSHALVAMRHERTGHDLVRGNHNEERTANFLRLYPVKCRKLLVEPKPEAQTR